MLRLPKIILLIYDTSNINYIFDFLEFLKTNQIRSNLKLFKCNCNCTEIRNRPNKLLERLLKLFFNRYPYRIPNQLKVGELYLYITTKQLYLPFYLLTLA